MALNVIAELEAVVDALDAEGVPYALCGGLALGIHGHPRTTRDIDILVEPDQVSRALAAARRVGFDIPARKMTFGLSTGTPREVHRVSKLDPETGSMMPLDFLLVNAELAEVWATRLRVETGARGLSIVSRAGLVTMKKIAGRAQDLVDLQTLEHEDSPDDEG